MTSNAGKLRIATAWLDGCSGCHMSLLDMDERIIDLLSAIEIVYSPLVDTKAIPDDVDLSIVEGSVSNADDEAKIRKLRHRSRYLLSLGDCAVTGNVPSMRNRFSLDVLYDRAYIENVTVQPCRPTDGVPALHTCVVPVHKVVEVDFFLPGCPPSADAIFFVLSELVAGRTPNPNQVSRFGA
jgi:NAD-reducing hydrogenase small subunit